MFREGEVCWTRLVANVLDRTDLSGCFIDLVGPVRSGRERCEGVNASARPRFSREGSGGIAEATGIAAIGGRIFRRRFGQRRPRQAEHRRSDNGHRRKQEVASDRQGIPSLCPADLIYLLLALYQYAIAPTREARIAHPPPPPPQPLPSPATGDGLRGEGGGARERRRRPVLQRGVGRGARPPWRDVRLSEA